MTISTRQLIAGGTTLLLGLGWFSNINERRYTEAAREVITRVAQNETFCDPQLSNKRLNHLSVPYVVHAPGEIFPAHITLKKIEAKPNGDGTFNLVGTSYNNNIGSTYTDTVERFRPQPVPTLETLPPPKPPSM